jgi:hypothetical protein
VLAAWLYSEFGALKTKLKNEKGDSQFFPWSQKSTVESGHNYVKELALSSFDQHT